MRRRIGDTFVYEILITNGGDKPVAFPASLQQSRFRRQMRDVISALLGLSCDDEMTGLQVFGTQALYGSPEVPGSVIVLRPKETLQLRAPGRWYMTSSFRKAPPKEWILNLWLRADLHLATLPSGSLALVGQHGLDRARRTNRATVAPACHRPRTHPR